jgi:hypothetical protein
MFYERNTKQTVNLQVGYVGMSQKASAQISETARTYFILYQNFHLTALAQRMR